MLERLSRSPAGAFAMIAGIVLVTALLLAALGHSLVCSCGTLRLWDGQITTAENSQHLTDWYSFSHLLYGLILYAFLRLVAPHWTLNKRLVVAAMIAAGWELGENTPFLIERYRDVTVSVNYHGDSIVNAVTDIVAALAGFGLAAVRPVWGSIALFLGTEALTAWAARDGLVLSVVMVTAPLEALRDWQLAR